MNIKNDILPFLEESLENSIQEGKEKLGLLVYYSKDDTVKGIVLAEFLESHGFIYNSNSECRLEDKLFESLRKFNLGQLNEIEIDTTKISRNNSLLLNPELMRVITYHTHPLEEQDIFPSKEDKDYAISLEAPAVVVGSKKARDTYKLKEPFVVLYTAPGALNYINMPLDERVPHQIDLALGEKTTERPLQFIKIATN